MVTGFSLAVTMFLGLLIGASVGACFAPRIPMVRTPLFLGLGAAWVGALFTTVLFEAARAIFAAYVDTFNPGSLYTGTLTAIVVVVLWTYYAALIFILGGEVGQVYELRRVRRLQREILG